MIDKIDQFIGDEAIYITTTTNLFARLGKFANNVIKRRHVSRGDKHLVFIW